MRLSMRCARNRRIQPHEGSHSCRSRRSTRETPTTSSEPPPSGLRRIWRLGAGRARAQRPPRGYADQRAYVKKHPLLAEESSGLPTDSPRLSRSRGGGAAPFKNPLGGRRDARPLEVTFDQSLRTGLAAVLAHVHVATANEVFWICVEINDR